MSKAESIQDRLGSFITEGKSISIPSTKTEGLLKYRELIFNNIESAISTAYPISKAIIPDDKWLGIVESFMEKHRAQTPFIWELPKEFMQFCQNENLGKELKIPFLTDLLQFEWNEIEIFNMSDIELPEYTNVGDIETDILVVNPEYKIQVSTFPVHKMNIEHPILEPQQSIIISFRHPVNKSAHYVVLSVLDALTFEKIIEEQISLTEAFEKVEIEIQQVISPNLKQQSIAFFNQLLYQKLFLGYQV